MTKLIRDYTVYLVYDYISDSELRNHQALFFAVIIEKEDNKTKMTQLKLTSLLISNMQVNLATGKEKQQITERIKKLSAEFETIIDDNTITF